MFMDGKMSLAATLVLLHLLAAKGESALWSTSCRCRLSLHSSLDLTGHGEESLLNVSGSLRRSFKEFDSKTVGKFLALFGGHNTFPGQIRFISHQKLVDVLGCISIDLVQPLFYIVEGFLISDVVHNDNTVGTTIVRRGDSSEALLSGCIPNLKLNGLSVKLNSANFLYFKRVGIQPGKENENRIMRDKTRFTRFTYEVDTNGGDV
jgi:hypothetical protein